jgi:hypothetical protein
MVMRGFWRVAGLLVVLAGCSSGPAPITTVAAVPNCATTPVLGGAPRLGLGSGPTMLVFDAKTPCLETPAGRAVYVGFGLPESQTPYRILLLSIPQGDTLFSPAVTTYAADGQAYRRVSREVFTLRGGLLQATVEVQPDERFMVINSDPRSVGSQTVEYTHTGMETAGAAGGFVIPRVRDTSRSITFTNAHNGTMTVEAKKP